jgi:hypothetical protein
MLICDLAVHQSCDGRRNVVLLVMERVRVVCQLRLWLLRFVHRVVAGKLIWWLDRAEQKSWSNGMN